MGSSRSILATPAKPCLSDFQRSNRPAKPGEKIVRTIFNRHDRGLPRPRPLGTPAHYRPPVVDTPRGRHEEGVEVDRNHRRGSPRTLNDIPYWSFHDIEIHPSSRHDEQDGPKVDHESDECPRPLCGKVHEWDQRPSVTHDPPGYISTPLRETILLGCEPMQPSSPCQPAKKQRPRI